MTEPLLDRRSPFRISYALLILTVFFFVLPSAFRAARLSLGKKENDVKDWLPSDFPETAELTWFARHFAGESFVVATWPGCVSGDQRLELLTHKLRHESALYDPAAAEPPEVAAEIRRAKQIGEELQLLMTGDDHYNWAGLKEKWLTSARGQHYYITPDGRLFRWEEGSNGPAALLRAVRKSLGTYQVKSQFVTAFGTGNQVAAADGETGVNRFYNDRSLLCAPLFHSVQTGDTIVAQLATEGGPLWPIDLTDASRRGEVAERLAMQRLTGSLFAPAVPDGFLWSGAAFIEAVPAEKRDSLPADFAATAESVVATAVRERFDGSLESLQEAPFEEQTEVWYEVFDTAGVEPPPRLTCVLVTLTALAKDNLAFALGRGVLGGPRGRLLRLAEECGVDAAPPPVMAPPPLDRLSRTRPSGRPQLHMGGPPVDNVAIDEEGTVTLVRLVGYSVLVGVVLSYLCFFSVKITVMVFVVGGTAAILSMAIVWWSGGRVDAILMTMPSLVYVLGLSGAIHVINYYRDEVRSRGAKGAAGRAIRHAMIPCFLASGTTAIGLVSLGTSNLAPISNFGIYSAVGVLATLAILFSYLPAALQTFAPSVPMPVAATGGADAPVEGRLSEAWAAVGRWITRHHVAVSLTCLLVLAVASVGMFKIRTSVQLLKLFDPESRIISDYAWLEQNFGKLVPMELVVRMPPAMQSEAIAAASEDDPLTLAASNAGVRAMPILERVEAVSRIRRVVHQTLGEPGLDVVGQAMSADTFLPPFPAPSNSYSPVRGRFNRELVESKDELRHSDYLRIEKEGPYAGSELWRISLRVAALSDVDYGRFIATLRTAVEPVLRAYETRNELLEALTRDENGDVKPLTGRQQVLVVGTGTPVPLDALELRGPAETEQPASELIDTEQTYLSTLSELLANERIPRPLWLDVSGPEPVIEVGSERWHQLLERVDAVVWVGGDSVADEDLESVRLVIDARGAADRATRPTLIDGKYPDVEGSEGMQVVYTGVIPVVYKAQRTLLASLVESIGSAFVMISVVMMIVLNPGRVPWGWTSASNLGNGVVAGAISMLPNMFPILFVFGVMGHAGVLVDIGTMMTASVALGVAVDDTIHFLSWFRTNLNAGMNRVDAVIETYRRVGPAMTQTTLVGGLGLFVFALSTFTPTQRFGTLMLVLLAVALVGDLVLLPALLAGPLGRFFKRREGSEESAIESTSQASNHATETRPAPPTASQYGDQRMHRPHGAYQRSDSPHRLK